MSLTPTDHDIAFMKAFGGALGLFIVGVIVVFGGLAFVLNLPSMIYDVWLMIARRWFPNLVPEEYRAKPPVE